MGLKDTERNHIEMKLNGKYQGFIIQMLAFAPVNFEPSESSDTMAQR